MPALPSAVLNAGRACTPRLSPFSVHVHVHAPCITRGARRRPDQAWTAVCHAPAEKCRDRGIHADYCGPERCARGKERCNGREREGERGRERERARARARAIKGGHTRTHVRTPTGLTPKASLCTSQTTSTTQTMQSKKATLVSNTILECNACPILIQTAASGCIATKPSLLFVSDYWGGCLCFVYL